MSVVLTSRRDITLEVAGRVGWAGAEVRIALRR